MSKKLLLLDVKQQLTHSLTLLLLSMFWQDELESINQKLVIENTRLIAEFKYEHTRVTTLTQDLNDSQKVSDVLLNSTSVYNHKYTGKRQCSYLNDKKHSF